jgi:hypothetical protein
MKFLCLLLSVQLSLALIGAAGAAPGICDMFGFDLCRATDFCLF